MYLHAHVCQLARLCTHLTQRSVCKWIMISAPTQCESKKAQLQAPGLSAVSTIQILLRLLLSSDPRFGISHNLFRQEGSHREYKRRHNPVKEQDTTRQGQRKWRTQTLTIHNGDWLNIYSVFKRRDWMLVTITVTMPENVNMKMCDWPIDLCFCFFYYYFWMN